MDHGVIMIGGAFIAMSLWGIGSIVVSAIVTWWTGCDQATF